MTRILTKVLIASAITACAGIGHATSALMNQNTDKAPRADVKVEMTTTEGNVTLLLYGDTPLHMENFVKLASEGFYDGLLFHRVINEFMVQGGDPDSRDAAPGAMLGSGDPDYQIEAEINYPRHFHKRGALAAARQGDGVNPERKSSGSQFYIVTGKVFTPQQLDQLNAQRLNNQKKAIFNSLVEANRDTIMSLRRARNQEGLSSLQQELIAQTEAKAAAAPDTIAAEQRDAYSTVGGAPHLDGAYTVFGEVISGMDTIDRIQKVETDSNDRPKQDVRILKMKVLAD